jgi:hypothetical protein
MGLARHFLGHDVKHTSQLGWGEVSNGNLLKLAEADGYRLMITADKNIPWQQSVAGRLLGILTLSTNNWPLMQPHIPAILEAVDAVAPGEVVPVNCGKFIPRKLRKPPGRLP